MNCLLYATNTSPQTLTDGQLINFGTPVRRYGKAIQVSGGNVTVNTEGYYPAIANVTFTPSANGTATLQLYENGVAIPGAKASIGVAANVTYSLVVPTAVRTKCCCEKSISAAIVGVDSSVSNASILVGKG